MNNILSNNEIEIIKKCGYILSSAMNDVQAAICPGIATKDLDLIAENAIRQKGATPSFKDYFVAGAGKYPASLCVSINDEVVHGIPKNNRVLKDGDIVSLDLGAQYNGICTDMAVTVAVGQVSDEALNLIKVTEECLKRGIQASKVGNRIGAIGEIVQDYAEKNNFGVIRDLVGHGIGIKPHMDPQIPNYGNSNRGPKILPGMALAIEPMITEGDFQIKVKDDNWTIITNDGSLAAHFEHTIVVTKDGPVVVTDIKG